MNTTTYVHLATSPDAVIDVEARACGAGRTLILEVRAVREGIPEYETMFFVTRNQLRGAKAALLGAAAQIGSAIDSCEE
jgi:hypothetical protein